MSVCRHEVVSEGEHREEWCVASLVGIVVLEHSVESLQNILDWLDRNRLTALHTGTQIIIAPGYTYRIVTNFHQPQSTLLLLVSAFIGDDWRRMYDYALSHDFRFLSYGDSSLLIP